MAIAAAAARHPRVIGLAHHLAAGLAGDLLRQRQALFGERAAGEQQQVLRAAIAQDLRRVIDGLRGIIGALAFAIRLRDAVGLVPGGIGGKDQGCDLRRRAFRGGNGGGAIGRHRLGVRRGPHPGRHRPRQALDVGGQRRVVADVVGGVLADDVDDAGIGLLGVVQVGEPIGQARAEMEQASRPACPSCGNSRRQHPSPRPRTGRARSACPRPGQGLRQSAFPTCRDC